MSGYSLADYVDVKTRVILFYQKYPDGSLQFEFKGVLESNPDMIWGIAYAYRTPDDPRPGIGTAAELAVGRTNFTRFSEMQNLESSAWGRAIGSLGLGLEKGIATRQEVEAAQARQEPNDDPWAQPVPRTGPDKPIGGMTDKQYKYIKACFDSFGELSEYIDAWKDQNNYSTDYKLSASDASKIIDQLKTQGIKPNYKRADIDLESKFE